MLPPPPAAAASAPAVPTSAWPFPGEPLAPGASAAPSAPPRPDPWLRYRGAHSRTPDPPARPPHVHDTPRRTRLPRGAPMASSQGTSLKSLLGPRGDPQLHPQSHRRPSTPFRASKETPPQPILEPLRCRHSPSDTLTPTGPPKTSPRHIHSPAPSPHTSTPAISPRARQSPKPSNPLSILTAPLHPITHRGH